jgi:hypothetical protein
MATRLADLRSRDERFRAGHEQISAGGKYVEYLFKVTESYVGSAKVFTGVAGALLALPLFQLKTLLMLVQISGMVWLLGGAGVALGACVIVGALYQLHSVQIIEDEVEYGGREYESYTRLLQREYRVMLLAMGVGISLALACIVLFFCKGNMNELKGL